SKIGSTKVIATDLLPAILQEFSASALDRGLFDQTCSVAADGRRLPFKTGSVQCVVSFGRGSAGARRDIVAEVARVTAPGGVILLDLINHFSIYELLRLGSWRRFVWVRRLLHYLGVLPGGHKYVHYGALGIRKFCAEYGFDLVRLHYVGSVPPLRNLLSVRAYRRLERVLPKRILGTTILGEFVRSRHPLGGSGVSERSPTHAVQIPSRGTNL
ncbi:MAG: class I SAM-dependent methyltransferase, partial [Acidimicrobiia bacterium]